MGAGLSANITSAYAWLAGTHRPGDSIRLFGFSRGAYTVRSLAGMLAACGLVRFPEARARRSAGRRSTGSTTRSTGRRGGARAVPHPPVTVDLLGVWDTVGTLGIPDSLGVLNLVDADERHRFHDSRLGPHVTHARQALALDETRGPFTPTAWTGPGAEASVAPVCASARRCWSRSTPMRPTCCTTSAPASSATCRPRGGCT